MNKAKQDCIQAFNVLATFPVYLIKRSVEDIKKYISNLEETRKLDNQIITKLHEEKTELIERCKDLIYTYDCTNSPTKLKLSVNNIKKLLEQME